MINEVNTWLANPKKDYAAGLALYNKYKNKNDFDKFFGGVTNPTQDSMHFKLLIKRMGDINRKLLSRPSDIKPEKTKLPITVKTIVTGDSKKKGARQNLPTGEAGAKNQRIKIVNNPLVDVKELPEELQKEYFRAGELTKLLAGKHFEMQGLGEATENDAKRKELAEEITTWEDERAKIWKKLDALNEKKNAGEKTKEPEGKTIAQKALRISNLENYIRREKVKIKKNPKRKAAGEKKITNWQKELDELRKQ
jgi:hypothetical protein